MTARLANCLIDVRQGVYTVRPPSRPIVSDWLLTLAVAFGFGLLAGVLV